jgi:hypothetical protein
MAQVLRHDLHVGGVQIELRANLPVREVQPHEVEAQYPHSKRLMITGQRRAGEIVEAARTCFAPVALGAAVYRRSQGSKRHLASGADAPARSTWHHPAALKG